MKKIYILFILFFTFISYGQNVTLLKNFNPKVKELKHNLNNTKDSLFLSSENSILKVDFFNENHEQTIEIKDSKALIPLQKLPVGEFIVEVQLIDKIVVMHIIKYDSNHMDSTTKSLKRDVAEGSGMMLDEEFNTIKSPPKKSIEFLLTGMKPKKITQKNKTFYWTVTQINNESGSSKTMKLVTQRSVERMITKNKLEHKSVSGNKNELTVWEVHNTTKFMEKQSSNPEFINSSSSELFNTSPYYSTDNTRQSL